MGEAISYLHREEGLEVVVRGETLEAAFEAAARAVFGVMSEMERIRPQRLVTVSFHEADERRAVVRWVNELLAASRSKGLAFGTFKLSRDGPQWTGAASGEPWMESLRRDRDVRRALEEGARVNVVSGGWECGLVVETHARPRP